MNERKISPFYRTLSPIGAAALPSPMKTKEKVEQGKGTADHLMPLGYFFYFYHLEHDPGINVITNRCLHAEVFLFFFLFLVFVFYLFFASYSPKPWAVR